MAETQRVKKSLRNTWVGFVSMALSLFVQFISRTVFIYVLGKDYNGINGLFSNVLQVLNLAELGFDFAVAYAMYTPLQKKDELSSAKIMNFLHSVHLTIALIVFLLGAACVPLLQHLIADDISTLPFDIDQIRIYFAIYLANTVVSYLWSYKRVIITADQDAYVISAVDNFGNVALYVIQIAVLLITKNYYVYLSLMAVKTLFGNLIISFIADKRYPFS